MKTRQRTAGRANTGFELRYNLFRHKRIPDLHCAVPEDRPVPNFITTKSWGFASTSNSAASREFDRTAAELGVRLNGFYLFQRPVASQVRRAPQKGLARTPRISYAPLERQF